MDPLIAARVYNNDFYPLLSRLPREALLCIFDYLYDDFVTLICLRIVSRKCFPFFTVDQNIETRPILPISEAPTEVRSCYNCRR
ncbi:hypothetical protein BDU57DRAFT_280343 [Ampelomyces quisqualis]|uniref:F-box domain-containing protein n=1 Tax=Ampelomyces quisqualis TaxID=50730 RepID=A0A6A5QNT3_AMPQU|nr:hypothetical protein BDU57DRAFT_280343 [Ampelomyces quisqualis]